MEERQNLKASIRKEAKKNKKLREKGLIPAVLYGHGVESKLIQMDENLFKKIYDIAKESTLINLIIDDQEPVNVIIQDLQYEEVTDKILHVDFYQVKMDEKINAEINLVFTGISSAVKELGGTLVKNQTAIEVKCFPNDLIKEIEVDVSVLKTFEDSIRVKDLNIPEKLELITEADLTVAGVMPPRSEEELSALNEEVKEDASKVAPVDEKKEKEEEGDKDGKKEEKK